MADALPPEHNSQTAASAAVLATKLYVPRVRSDFVARPRLADRLADPGGGLLTLVSAPAGFGKTSLVADWIARSGRAVAWVSLDEDENEPARLLAYLSAALERASASLGAPLAPLVGTPTPLKPAFAAVINAVAEWDEDLTLALDDYHAITSELVHEAVAYFVDRLPPNLHVVIVTRSDPPFPLARWRASGRLREFRVADLRFEDAEAAAFLNESMGLGLAPTELAALTERTEGWIAGLQLAALSLRGRDDAFEFVRAFAGDDRYVIDYLVEEVLNRQPAPMQEFLLRTSVLRRLCGPLCDEVTGGADGCSMLEQLERRNLFLVPLDPKREWYRYHHLFADLLRFRLGQQYQELAAELNRRASVWFEAHGFADEAIHHALGGRDWERAVSLISGRIGALLAHRQFATIKAWVGALPDEELARAPHLCFSFAFAHLDEGDWDGAERIVSMAEAAWRDTPDTPDVGMLWSLRAIIACATGRAAETARYAAEARRRAGGTDPLPDITCHMAVGYARLLEGRPAEAEPEFVKAVAPARAIGHFFALNVALCHLGHVEALRGRLHEAARTVREVLQYESAQYPELVASAHSLIADLEREWNNLDAAGRHFERALEVRHSAWPLDHFLLVRERMKQGALTAWARGERQAAFDLIEQASASARHFGVVGVEDDAEALRALFALRDGDLTSASRWALSCGLGADDAPDFDAEFRHGVLARVLLARGEAGAAARLLTALVAAAHDNERVRAEIELRLLEALALRALERPEEAIAALAEALALAAPEGFVRTFLDESQGVVELLGDTVRARGRAWRASSPQLLGYAVQLQECFGAGAGAAGPSTTPGSSEPPWWYRADPLRDRELEVLSLVAEGLSNEAIAGRLFISARTVKCHVSNIYLKLDVHSRTQAVARAREFGLL